jgi:hypothetical protein
MTALVADHIAALRAGLAAGMNAQSMTYKAWSSGVLGAEVSFSGVVTRDERLEAMRDDGRKEFERIIDVRPTTAVPVRLGDQVAYDGTTFVIRALSGADVPRMTCVAAKSMGAQSRDGLRSEGR